VGGWAVSRGRGWHTHCARLPARTGGVVDNHASNTPKGLPIQIVKRPSGASSQGRPWICGKTTPRGSYGPHGSGGKPELSVHSGAFVDRCFQDSPGSRGVALVGGKTKNTPKCHIRAESLSITGEVSLQRTPRAPLDLGVGRPPVGSNRVKVAANCGNPTRPPREWRGAAAHPVAAGAVNWYAAYWRRPPSPSAVLVPQPMSRDTFWDGARTARRRPRRQPRQAG